MTTVKLAGPESTSYEGFDQHDIAGSLSSIDIMAVHSYESTQGSTYIGNYRSAVNSSTKSSWQTEWAPLAGPVSGATWMQRLQYAMQIFSADMRWGGNSTWMYWQGWNPTYKMTDASQETLLLGRGYDDMEETGLYKGFKTIFNNVKPDDYIVTGVTTTDPSLTVSNNTRNDLAAFWGRNGKFIVIVNSSTNEKKYTINNVDGQYATVTTITGDDALTEAESSYTASNGTLSGVTVPANSVCYVDAENVQKTSLTAKATSSSVVLSWGQANGASSYAVYRDNTALNTNVSGLTYTDTTTEHDKTYTYTVYAKNGGYISDAAEATVKTPLASLPTVNAEEKYAYQTDDGHERASIDPVAQTEHFDNISTMDAKYHSPDGDKSEFWYAKTNIPANTTHYALRTSTTAKNYAAAVDATSLEFYISWFDDVTLAAGAKLYAGIESRTSSQYQILAVDITNECGTMNWDSGPSYKKVSIPLSTLRDSGTLTLATPMDGWLGAYFGTINSSLTGSFNFGNITGIAFGIVTGSAATPAKFCTSGIKLVRTLGSPAITKSDLKNGTVTLAWKAVNGAEKYYVYNETDQLCYETDKTSYTESVSGNNVKYKVYAAGGTLVSNPSEAEAGITPEPVTDNRKVVATLAPDDGHDRVSLDAVARTEHFDNINSMDTKYLSPEGGKSEFWYAKSNIPANTTHYVIRNATTAADYSAYVNTATLEFYISWFDDVALAAGAKVYAGIASKAGSRYQVLAADITNQWGTMNWDSGPSYRKISIPLSTLRDSGTLTQATAIDGWEGEYLGTINSALTGSFNFNSITGFAVGISTGANETPAKFCTADIKYVQTIAAPEITVNVSGTQATLTWAAVSGATKYHVYDKTIGADVVVTGTSYVTQRPADEFNVYADNGSGLISEATYIDPLVPLAASAVDGSKVTVKNGTGKAKDATVILMHSQKGVLKAIGEKTLTLKSGTNTVETGISAAQAGYDSKVFIWDSLSAMRPAANTFTVAAD